MSQSIFIGTRIRPKFLPETQKPIGVQIEQENYKVVVNNSVSKKQFVCDFVFDESTTQKQIYERVGLIALDSFIEGVQTNIIMYGKNKTGKTYTLFGKQSEETKGIIPRIFNDLEIILNNESYKHCLFKISCLYIINENLYDLLNYQKAQLKLKKTLEKGIYVENLQCKEISKMEELQGYLDYLNRKKTILHTKFGRMVLNSHTILTIQIETHQQNCIQPFKTGKINFVQVSTPFQESSQIKLEGSDSVKLNLSSLALQNVIYALVDGRQKSKIPYNDSILTKLLQKSFGGDSRTIFLFTLDPLQQNFKQTIKLMRLSQKLKQIENHPLPKLSMQKTNLETILSQIQQYKKNVINKCDTIFQESGEGEVRRQNNLIYRNQFIPQNKQRDLRFSQKNTKNKKLKEGKFQSQKTEKKINWLEKKLLKIEKAEKELDKKSEIKKKVRGEIEKMRLIQQEQLQQVGKSQKIFKEKKKQINQLEQQFQQQREDYLEAIRELQRKCSFYKQISQNMLTKSWLKMLENNTEYEDNKRTCKVPNFRIYDRRLQFSKKNDVNKNENAQKMKEMVISPKARQSGQKGRILSSKKSLQLHSKSSQPRIKSEQKSFFAPYLTRKTFKTGFKRKEQEKQRQSEYYQVIDGISKKQKALSNDLLYRSWSQKNMS